MRRVDICCCFAILHPFTLLLITMLAFLFEKELSVPEFPVELTLPSTQGWTCGSNLMIKALHSLVTVICLLLDT